MPLLPPENNFADLREAVNQLLKTTKDENVKRLAGIVRPETIAWLLSRRLQNDKEDQSVKQWSDDALTYERYRDKFGDLFDRGPDGV